MTDKNTKLRDELKYYLQNEDLNTKIPEKYADLMEDIVGKGNITNPRQGCFKLKHFGESLELILERLRDSEDDLLNEPYFLSLDKCRKKNAEKQKKKINRYAMEGGGDDTLEDLLKEATKQQMNDRFYLEVPGSEDLRL